MHESYVATGARMPIERNCPACQAVAHSPVGIEREPWTLVRCDGCDFVYLPLAPTYEETQVEFEWDASVRAEKKRRKKARPVTTWLDAKTRWRLHMFPRPETYRFIEQLVPTGGNVLDIGCGDGRQALRLSGDYTPYGVEISDPLGKAADEAFRPLGGLAVTAPAIEGLACFDDAMFDGVMLNSYLEHELEPAGVLQAIRPKLKPEGVIVIKVPNFGSWNAAIMKQNWCGVRLPDHVNYFTPRSLGALAGDLGYAVDYPASANLPTNDNFWAFLRPAAGANLG